MTESNVSSASICKDDNQLDPSCFAQAQDFAFGKLERYLLTFHEVTVTVTVWVYVTTFKQHFNYQLWNEYLTKVLNLLNVPECTYDFSEK